jgi:hypothetical protein
VSSAAIGQNKYPEFLLSPTSIQRERPQSQSLFKLVGISKAKSELANELQHCNISAVDSDVTQKPSTSNINDLPGSKLKDYEMVKELGQGASGKVYLMKLKTDRTIWVVKQVMLMGSARSAAPSSDRHGAIARMERDNVLREVAMEGLAALMCFIRIDLLNFSRRSAYCLR